MYSNTVYILSGRTLSNITVTCTHVPGNKAVKLLVLFVYDVCDCVYMCVCINIYIIDFSFLASHGFLTLFIICQTPQKIG